MRVIITILVTVGLWLLPGVAEASSFVASHSGDCYDGKSINWDGVSWSTSDSSGFQFVAYWDPVAGCEPTVVNPTNGFYFSLIEENGNYTIKLVDSLKPSCGRVQFDGQSYFHLSSILDPSQLKAALFNFGVDCLPSSGNGDEVGGIIPIETPGSGGSNGGGSNLPPNNPLPDTPVPVPVPESGSVLLFGTGLLLGFRKIREKIV